MGRAVPPEWKWINRAFIPTLMQIHKILSLKVLVSLPSTYERLMCRTE